MFEKKKLRAYLDSNRETLSSVFTSLAEVYLSGDAEKRFADPELGGVRMFADVTKDFVCLHFQTKPEAGLYLDAMAEPEEFFVTVYIDEPGDGVTFPTPREGEVDFYLSAMKEALAAFREKAKTETDSDKEGDDVQ